MFELIVQTIANAVIASSFTAIIAVGLVLIVGVMQIVNFAHGELYMVGAYTLWYLYIVIHNRYVKIYYIDYIQSTLWVQLNSNKLNNQFLELNRLDVVQK